MVLKSKAQLRLLKDLARRRGIRDLEKRFLIVCEDKKSAPNYFRALLKHLGLSATSVVVCHSDGRTQPLQVVTEAVRRKDMSSRGRDTKTRFHQVWCVVDGDFEDGKIASARVLANEKRVRLAISNKCFEYWVLLHFVRWDTMFLDSSAVVSQLKKHVPDYEKGSCTFVEIVHAYDVAVSHARAIRRENDLPEHQNPCSEIYLLIDEIVTAMAS